jgi:gliding motility-associated-like protein
MKWSVPILLLFSYFAGLCQKENLHWHFGYNCSLDFSAGTPIWSGSSPIYTEEGSSSISDSAGNYLFSVQGTQIFDRNNNPMPGGSQLKGSTSSTQNSLIVPFVDDDENRYYHVFTVAAQNDAWPTPYQNTGLEHSVVDIEANNGNGEVIQASTEIIPWVAEKIHASYHANGHDVWVVVRGMNSNAYYSILIDCQGLNSPVVSQSGFFLNTDFESIVSQGALKISPDGSKIACTYSPVLDSTYKRNLAILEYAEFNNMTGVVSNVDTVQVTYPPSQMVLAYGLEFSPDNSKLYWTVQKYQSDLFQMDYNAPNFKQSRALIGNYTPSIASLQLAPDGKIYVAQTGGSQQLKVINNPNQTAGNVIVQNGPAVYNYLTHGLPNFWNIQAPPKSEISYDTLVECPENKILLYAPDKWSDYKWSDGSESAFLNVNGENTYFVHQKKCPRDTAYFEIVYKDTCICDIFLPNAYTPNGDGINEGFKAISSCDLAFFEIIIYNRWGEIVFKSNDIEEAWTPSANNSKSDIFVYKVSYAFRDNGVIQNQRKTGHISLIF